MRLLEMPYQNPPVVEVALTFHYKPSDQTPAWGRESGLDFLKRFSEYPKQGQVINQDIQVITDINGKPYTNTPQRTVKEIHVKNDDETEILGVGKHYLTYHKIRSGTDYPHYSPVAEKVFEYLPQYKEFWKPEKIQNIVLSYVDIIVIPETNFDINGYFDFGVRFPSEVGEISQFENHFVFQPKNKCGIGLNMQFNKIPFAPPNHTQFYLFCNYYKNICDESRFEEDAEDVHQHAYQIFERMLTDKCKKLFNS